MSGAGLVDRLLRFSDDTSKNPVQSARIRNTHTQQLRILLRQADPVCLHHTGPAGETRFRMTYHPITGRYSRGSDGCYSLVV